MEGVYTFSSVFSGVFISLTKRRIRFPEIHNSSGTRNKESLELTSDTCHRPRDDAVAHVQGNPISRRIIPEETTKPVRPGFECLQTPRHPKVDFYPGNLRKIDVLPPPLTV